MRTSTGAERRAKKRTEPVATHIASVQCPAKSSQSPPDWRKNLWIYLLLTAATLVVFANVYQLDFLNWDDQIDVTHNAYITHGLTWSGIQWALTSVENPSFWMPITRLSHMLDVSVFGMWSGGHHISNLLFHILATLLLFAFLQRATGARWRSAFVALLFALHPLRVESVAWVTERKDVLSGFLSFLTLWAYTRYAESSKRSAYWLAFCFFCLASMAKPMTVMLPMVLLLLDFWPLRRITFPLAPSAAPNKKADRPVKLSTIVLEKIPFFAVSGLAAIVTLALHRNAVNRDGIPFMLRMANAATSYLVYIGKTFWPVNLAAIYPYPHSIPAWEFGLAAVALAGISFGAYRALRKYPYIATGWLWYLLTLVPVIGIIQDGDQARADRFTYVPVVGILIAVVWLAADLLKRWNRGLIALGIAACLSAGALSFAQVPYWKNPVPLFQHALEVTGDDNYVAHFVLGEYYLHDANQLPPAIDQLRASLRLHPGLPEAELDLGVAFFDAGRLPEAKLHLQRALTVEPNNSRAEATLGMVFAQAGRLEDAKIHLERALILQPGYVAAESQLGAVLLNSGHLEEARIHLERVLLVQPNRPEAEATLGAVLIRTGHLQDARTHLERALRLHPNDPETETNLASLLCQVRGHLEDAIAHYQAAIRLKPDFAVAHYDLASLLATLPGSLPEAAEHFETALKFSPDADTHYRLAQVLLKIPGRAEDGIQHLQQAIQMDPGLEPARQLLRSSRHRP